MQRRARSARHHPHRHAHPPLRHRRRLHVAAIHRQSARRRVRRGRPVDRHAAIHHAGVQLLRDHVRVRAGVGGHHAARPHLYTRHGSAVRRAPHDWHGARARGHRRGAAHGRRAGGRRDDGRAGRECGAGTGPYPTGCGRAHVGAAHHGAVAGGAGGGHRPRRDRAHALAGSDRPAGRRLRPCRRELRLALSDDSTCQRGRGVSCAIARGGVGAGAWRDVGGVAHGVRDDRRPGHAGPRAACARVRRAGSCVRAQRRRAGGSGHGIGQRRTGRVSGRTNTA